MDNTSSNRIIDLEKLIISYNEYYRKGEPKITDEELAKKINDEYRDAKNNRKCIPEEMNIMKI